MIHEGLRTPWEPASIRGALQAFRQGTIIEAPPLLYWANPEAPLWAASARDIHDEDPAPSDGESVAVADEDRPTYGVITTQTCDIQEAAKSPKKPWVQIAPVVRPWDGASHSGIRAGTFTTFLHWIPCIPGDDLWAADLRIEIPVEKGWLASRASGAFDGFETSEQRIAFAERLARLRSRPAFAEPVVVLLRQLREQLQGVFLDEALRERFLDPVVELALRFQGDEDDPASVQIVVLSEEALSDEVKDFYAAEVARAAEAAECADRVVAPDLRPLQEVPASEYRTFFRVDWDELSPTEEG